MNGWIKCVSSYKGIWFDNKRTNILKVIKVMDTHSVNALKATRLYTVSRQIIRLFFKMVYTYPSYSKFYITKNEYQGEKE